MGLQVKSWSEGLVVLRCFGMTASILFAAAIGNAILQLLGLYALAVRTALPGMLRLVTI
jgi:hypothetical protein